jgi:hypothetical protein
MSEMKKIMQRFDVMTPTNFNWMASVTKKENKPFITIYAFPKEPDPYPKMYYVDLSNKNDVLFWIRHLQQFPTVKTILEKALN